MTEEAAAGRGERIEPASRRASWTVTLQTKGENSMKAHVTLGMRPTGDRVCEIFIAIGKGGSDVRAIFEAWARTASVALQCGTPLRILAGSIRKMPSGDAKAINENGDEVDCSGMWDLLAQLLEKYL